MKAQTALTWGLIEQVYGVDTLWNEALTLARRIADNATLSNRANKQTVAQIMRDPDDRDIQMIKQLSRLCQNSADFREGRDAFREKRAPKFTGE